MTGEDQTVGALKLRVDHVRKEYPNPGGAIVVLNDAAFEMTPGETLAVTGPSGSGKSTLLNVIGSLDLPTSGTVWLGGWEIPSLDAAQLAEYRSQKVGFIFQDHHLLPQCTALENVMLPTLAMGGDPSAYDRAAALLERVGLVERMHALPAKLSGGERQRVAIARAMVNEPPLLLCDEPTGNLDREAEGRVAELFVELAAEKNAMLIVVTHNLNLAARCQRRLELRDGTLETPTGQPL